MRYEDIINEDEKEVAEALVLADPDVVAGRTRRLKRAIDLNFKRKNFMDYAPDVEQETFKAEFYEDVEKIKARDAEYAMLNAHNK
jgi:ubiquinol-cytochrome c reductase subunit 7